MTGDHEERIKRLEERVKRLERRGPGDRLHIDARAVRASMAEKGWNQSDLAAQMWGRAISSEGKNVAKGKDRLSVWLSGKGSPSPANWSLLRKFVDVV